MSIIPQPQRYIPHELTTRYHACEIYLNAHCKVSYVTRRYYISKASLMRWMKRYDGTKASLMDHSHTPHTLHSKAHTEQELKWIKNYLRRSPDISMIELYGKLRLDKGYSRHPASLFRLLWCLGYYQAPPKTDKVYVPKPYDTPQELGIKWQCDVKYVPKRCKAPSLPENTAFFQYTMIEEASRERYLYPYDEHSKANSADFVKRSIRHYGYQPDIIQTDNGFEFTQTKQAEQIHTFKRCLDELGIHHQLIRPRTPRHNGKVKRSHRNDNERFYKTLSFYSFPDLRLQMKHYLFRSNRIPMATLNYLTPIQKRTELLQSSTK